MGFIEPLRRIDRRFMLKKIHPAWFYVENLQEIDGLCVENLQITWHILDIIINYFCKINTFSGATF